MFYAASKAALQYRVFSAAQGRCSRARAWRIRRHGLGLVAALSLLGATSSTAAAEGLDSLRLGIAAGAGLSGSNASALVSLLARYDLPGGAVAGLSLGGVWLNTEYSDRPTQPRLLRALPELGYQWDVLRWVPRVGLASGYQWDPRVKQASGVVAPFIGVDYLLTRAARLGLEYRPAWYPGIRLESGQRSLLQHELCLRLELGSGW